MQTKIELSDLFNRYRRAAKSLQTAAFAMDDAVSETNGTGYGDRTRELLYRTANLLLELTATSGKLAEQVESMPPDEEDAGDALQAAERADRFETV